MLFILISWYSCYIDIPVVYSSYLFDTCLYIDTHATVLQQLEMPVYLLFVPITWGVIYTY